jgi:hypothetical protein
VQRHLDVRQLLERALGQVGQDAADDGLKDELVEVYLHHLHEQ